MDTPTKEPSSNPLASGAAHGGGLSTGSNTTSESAVGHPGGAGFIGAQPSTSQHQPRRDVDLAGAGAVTIGGLYEHEKNKDASLPASDAASTTAVKDFPAITQPTSATSSSPAPAPASEAHHSSTSTTNQPDKNHLGRDIAAAGGTGTTIAGAEAALKKHERAKDDYDFTDPSPYSSRAVDPRIDTVTRRMPGAWPRGDSYQSEAPQDTRNDQMAAESMTTAHNEPEVKTHDFGRDAAIAGAVGAAGLGAHELQKDSRQQEPYPQDTAATHAKAAEPVSEDTDIPTHHYVRDAVAAGGLGAAGVGAYDAEKNLEQKGNKNIPTETTDPAVSTVKPAQHIATTEPSAPFQQDQPEQHYVRDAALAGGAGATSLGAYEAYKNHEEPVVPAQPAITTEAAPAAIDKAQPLSTIDGMPMGTQPAATQPQPQDHYGRGAAIAGVGTVGAGAYEAGKYQKAETAPHQPIPAPTDQAPTTAIPRPEKTQPEHHYGRDAGIVGGTGAAAYEAEKHHSRPEEKAAMLYEPPTTHTEPAVSPLEDYASSTYSQTDAAPFITREIAQEPQPQHHYGHDAALAGGAGTAMWFGADEVEKKRRQHDSMDPELENVAAHMQPRYEDQRAEMHDHSAERHAGFAGATETLPAAKSLKGKEPAADAREQHHLGRDAALAGGLGGAGVGAYEVGKHHQTKEEEAMAAGTGHPVDADYEYVKNHGKEHGMPERTATHLKKHSREEKEKHGSVLGKIFHRKSRSNMANDVALAEDEKDRSPVVDTGAKYGAGAIGAEEVARSYDSPTATTPVERYSATPERHTSTLTPTRSPTEKRHSPKHSGEFAHLGRNKLHKDPPTKYLEKRERERADGSGSNSPPSRMTSSATQHMGGDGQIGNPYVSDLPEDGAYRGVDNGGVGEPTSSGLVGGVVTEPHTGLPMNVGQYGSGAGGTDERANVEGFHGGVQDLRNYDGPGWENIRKNDTIY